MFQDRIFLGAGGHVVALAVATGQELWRTRLGGMFSSGYVTGVALLNGRLYATCNGEVSCLDPATGHIHWHNGLPGLGTGYVAVAGEAADAAAHQQAATASATTAAATAAVVVATTVSSS